MQLHFATFFAVLAAVGINAQTLQINTPTNVVQCLPQLITWSGGTGFLKALTSSVLPGGEPSAAALVDFGQQSGTQLTWVVNIQSGTSVDLTIRDQTGTVANSAPFTIGAGSDSSCVGQSASTVSGSSTGVLSATTGASGTTTSSSSSSTAPGSTTSGSSTATKTSASSSSSGSASHSSSSSASSSTKSSAAKPFAQIGSAGVIGAIVVAVFA